MDSYIIEIINTFDHIEDEYERKKIILKTLDSIDLMDLEPYLMNYIKGYLWYEMPEEGEKRSSNIEKYLKQSISQNKDYPYSTAYLSYHFFDQKKFFEVIELLDSFDFSQFEEFDQLWQSLKLEELFYAAKLYFEDIVSEQTIDGVYSVIQVYLNVPEEILAVPNEIVHAVIDNKNKYNMTRVISTTRKLVNSIEYKDYFQELIF